MTKGATQSYLGMQIILQEHSMLINMSFFINSTMEDFQKKMDINNIKQCAAPGNKNYLW